MTTKKRGTLGPLQLTERKGTIHDREGKRVGSFRLATSDPLLTELGGDYLEKLLTPEGGTIKRTTVMAAKGKNDGRAE